MDSAWRIIKALAIAETSCGYQLVPRLASICRFEECPADGPSSTANGQVEGQDECRACGASGPACGKFAIVSHVDTCLLPGAAPRPWAAGAGPHATVPGGCKAKDVDQNQVRIPRVHYHVTDQAIV